MFLPRYQILGGKDMPVAYGESERLLGKVFSLASRGGRKGGQAGARAPPKIFRPCNVCVSIYILLGN
jgi:hypothetical protein